jgi:death on curing protein
MTTYLSKDQIIAIHRDLIDSFGGLHGIREESLLESAVGRYQSGYYADVIEEAAALMESLGVNHPFIDGNKRIAVIAPFTFLNVNGYELLFEEQQAFDFISDLFESHEFVFSRLEPWIRANVVMHDQEHTEEEEQNPISIVMQDCQAAMEGILLARREFSGAFDKIGREFEAIRSLSDQVSKSHITERKWMLFIQSASGVFKRAAVDINLYAQRIRSEGERFLRSWATAAQWTEEQIVSINEESTLREILTSVQQYKGETNKLMSSMSSLPDRFDLLQGRENEIRSVTTLKKTSINKSFEQFVDTVKELEHSVDSYINTHIQFNEQLNITLHSCDRLIGVIEAKLQNQARP